MSGPAMHQPLVEPNVSYSNPIMIEDEESLAASKGHPPRYESDEEVDTHDKRAKRERLAEEQRRQNREGVFVFLTIVGFCGMAAVWISAEVENEYNSKVDMMIFGLMMLGALSFFKSRRTWRYLMYEPNYFGPILSFCLGMSSLALYGVVGFGAATEGVVFAMRCSLIAFAVTTVVSLPGFMQFFCN